MPSDTLNKNALLQADSLSFSYGIEPVLKNIRLQMRSGEMIGIIGPNGAGKTTLIKLLAGILPAQKGAVYANGKQISEIKRKEIARLIAYVPQTVDLQFDFAVEEIIGMGRYPFLQGMALLDDGGRPAVEQALRTMDLQPMRRRSFLSLSGGEKQRTIIASALAQQTEIMLLDEPTSSLDLKHQQQIYRILRRLTREENKLVVLITHDINLSAQFCDRMVLLHNGAVIADGRPDEVLKFNLIQQVYGVKVYIDVNPLTDTLYILPYDTENDATDD
ncbi:MAG TPA: heme ABC transporter ATP-binding protein [Caldithrix abyssi]|uniref:Heme ABC transporter ATP-binding protein n=1 Tax=Caldithrix abyssi TaxID=187145 RepID=A0A7V4U1A2_CALAY|nr:heme ABC transporter ATP-binding protein [Caldithrix abyssi]